MMKSRKEIYIKGERWFYVLGALIHIFYLSSVFHIYFKSSILKGLQSVSYPIEIPAKRLVLIVADGLPAEKAFSKNAINTVRFLRSLIKNKGIWGVSHTRVPTETRVGHVSLIAGSFEDVSAIFNGWKYNPVEFDSVFNQSSRTWCWGNPDILHIFEKDATNIVSHSYIENQIHPSQLDEWVFNHVEDFFANVKKDEELFSQLHSDKIVFFLHLLGTDSIGHIQKPDSEMYRENMAVLNHGIERVVSLIDNFYQNDGKTSYIVTSDHGMTSSGGHGTNLQIETESPFIAWGAGIQRPVFQRHINHDSQSAAWGLEDFRRYDIKQVDIPPLMSFLIGANIPVNSIGVLPHKILDVSEETKANGLLKNAKQLIEQYHAYENKFLRLSFGFNKYFDVNARMEVIHNLMKQQKFSQAVATCEELIGSVLDGIQYYQQYHRFFLSFMVNLGFISWILYILMRIIEQETGILKNQEFIWKPTVLTYGYYVSLATVWLIYWMKSVELTDIMYTLLPLVICERTLHGGFARFKVILMKVQKSHVSIVFQIIACLIGIEVIVFSFYNRGALSVITICLSMLPWYKFITTSTPSQSTLYKILCVAWTVVSVVISIFPMLPVVRKEENYTIVILAGFIALTLSALYCYIIESRDRYVTVTLAGLLVFSLVLKMNSVQHVKHGEGLPLTNQICSWTFLFLLPCISLLVNRKSITRLFSISLALFSVYILTSISYDALFLLVLTLQLCIWITLEVKMFKTHSSSKNWSSNKNSVDVLTTDHLRISFMVIYFLYLASFGVGNIVSIKSIDNAMTCCFKTVHNPWYKECVLAMRVLTPFLIVTVFFRSLQSLTCLPMRSLFSIILILTDIMAINFFILVKNEGSWLDMGLSVSHFVIATIFILIFSPIYELSYYVSGRIELEK